MDKQDILNLKKITQAGVVDCKQALEESDGDFQKAIMWLRKKGQTISAKRIDKRTDKGGVFAKTNADKTLGIILLLGCETDFVARNDLFHKLANRLIDIALKHQCMHLDYLLQIAEDDVTVQQMIKETSAILGEKILITEYNALEGRVVSHYIHIGNRLGSLISLDTSQNPITLELGKNLAMQVVLSDVLVVDEDSIDPVILAREKLIIEEGLKQINKPEEVKQKIAKGKLDSFIKEITLITQPYIKDNSQTVLQYIKKIDPTLKINGFKRFSIVI